jgi:hypothetical protein
MKTKPILLLILLIGVFGFAPAETSAIDRLDNATQSLRYAPSARDSKRLSTILAETYDAAAASTLFDGPAGTEATALFLYALMYHESGIRPHIEHCNCTRGDGDCDKGLAAGLPQIHPEWFQGHTKSEVCADRRLQMELAMDLLQRVKKVCGGNPDRIAAGYHYGTSCEVAGYAQNVRGVFVRLLEKAKIRMRRDRAGWSAVFEQW